VALAAAGPASAQEMTIDALVATALERAPALRAARAGVAAAQGQALQAGLRPNPMVSLARLQQLGGADSQTDVGVEWLLDGSRRQARVAAAQQDVTVAELSVQDRARMLAAAVRTQAGRLLAATRTLTIADEALTSARRMRELLERRASEGSIPQIEANLAALEMWRLEADRAVAAGEAEAAAIELKALAGLPVETPLTLSGSLDAIVRGSGAAEPPPAAQLAARPDVREAAARVALGDARLEAVRRDAGIETRLTGGYSHMRFGFPLRGITAAGALAPIEDGFHFLTAGASFTVPIGNRNQGAIAAVEAERAAARELLAARELAVRAGVDAALARDREARRAVDLYAASIRELAQRNADVILEAYELGGLPLVDLLDNQRRYLEIEHAYTAALSRAYDARVALRVARGDVR
jgi:cobalt-zinc-cadmium efflux system outer membrane protein